VSPLLSHLAAAACGILATLALLGPHLLRLHRRAAAAEYDATHDGLTGLANRRAVLTHLRDATRRSQPVGVILFDLDNFKAINDTPGVGHAGGDDLLRQVARLLRVQPGPVRLAGRLGGDEFVLVVDGNADTTSAIAHDIWELITGAPFTVADHAFDVAVSIGHVTSRLGWTASQLLHYADLAMYQAKHDHGGVARYHRVPADAEVVDRPAQRCRDRCRCSGTDNGPPTTT
jgi:diguanylate cyclase (GGDEF)-like protein